jgi:hypothetical protein
MCFSFHQLPSYTTYSHPIQIKKEFIPRKRRLLFSGVSRALDLAFDVVSLAEESEPVIEHFLVLVRQIRPVGSAFFWFERGLSQSAGGVFAGEDCESSFWLVVFSAAAAVLTRDIWEDGEGKMSDSVLDWTGLDRQDLPLYEPSGP